MTDTILNPAAASPRHLDADTLARFRSSLVSERSAQAAVVIEQEAVVRSLMAQIDAYSILERELAERLADRARAAITEIDDALARLEAGTYGSCGSCGDPIAVERLEAIPHAGSCVACPDERRGVLG
jgi:RNA polymerase-binding protein DksA